MRVVLGYSGGVDSSVAALLLQKQGHEVLGLYMDNAGEDACREAIAGAQALGIPLTVVDAHKALEERVCRPFQEAYLRGETPNPCILCNPEVKFRFLLEEAQRRGAEAIATGHYARAEDGRLYKGRSENDQSYMLCRLERAQLDRLILPLGSYCKSEVRALAEDFGLAAAHKPDSMEICFIPDKDYVGWLSRRASLPGPGPFLFHGQKLGRHEGICRYTVGQRRPGLYGGRKLYVSLIDAAENSVELALWEELFQTELRVRDFRWLVDPPAGPVRGSVRVRHTKWENPACTAWTEGEALRIRCDEPVRAPAPGQTAALYQGEQVLGGGFLTA